MGGSTASRPLMRDHVDVPDDIDVPDDPGNPFISV
jgi:hypothetical protein